MSNRFNENMNMRMEQNSKSVLGLKMSKKFKFTKCAEYT